MRLVANARMYSVNPAAAATWKELFAWLSSGSGISLDVIDHAFPLPLSELWSRRDLASAFMCGFPFVLAAHRPRPVAAPVPASALIPGKAVYATRIVVRADSRFASLEDTFGGRLGFTVEDSQSGYNALRHHLLPYYRQCGKRLYRESVGPLFTPRRVIEALLSGGIDAGPLDRYALDLMIRHQPDLARQVRVVATTEPTPIPFLVAGSDCPGEVIAALQATFAKFGHDSECADLRDRLCLAAFAPVAIEDYEIFARWDAEARDAGYDQPG